VVWSSQSKAGSSRTDPNRQPLSDEALGNPSASLAVAPEDQRHFVLLCTHHNFFLLLLNGVATLNIGHLGGAINANAW